MLSRDTSYSFESLIMLILKYFYRSYLKGNMQICFGLASLAVMKLLYFNNYLKDFAKETNIPF